MENTPKSLRLHLAIAGRINVGKSTLFNLISGQDAAITSPERGTTTDVVEKTLELRPLGAAVLLDTAGSDDDGVLGKQRLERTENALKRADAIILTVSPGVWDAPENAAVATARELNVPLIAVINIHSAPPAETFVTMVRERTGHDPLSVCAIDRTQRSDFLNRFTEALQKVLPDELITPPLLRDLLPAGGTILLMTPIDTQAPKGRLILPQVQAIRDALDGDCTVTVAKESAFPDVYRKFTALPDLVVCDSQVVKMMINTAPAGVKMTTFSILMARMKGDLETFARGCAALERLAAGSRVLIAESCTHHAGSDDIGRVKIPRMLMAKTGRKLEFEFCAGHDFPDDLSPFKIVVHCGSCMLNRRETLNRLEKARAAGKPVVNYGILISYCQGVSDRVIAPLLGNGK